MPKRRPKPAKEPPAPAVAPSTISQVDRDLATAALEKRRTGQAPTTREASALKRVQADQEDRTRRAYYRTIPKRHYREMCGRQDKVLNEQAARYGMPIAGPTIDLYMLLTWVHQFIADNAKRLATPLGEDPLLFIDSDDPWLTELRKQGALLKKLEREEKERKLLPRDKCHDGLARFANVLRRFGEWLEKHHGRDALEMFNATLDDASRELMLFADEEDDGKKPS